MRGTWFYLFDRWMLVVLVVFEGFNTRVLPVFVHCFCVVLLESCCQLFCWWFVRSFKVVLLVLSKLFLQVLFVVVLLLTHDVFGLFYHE